MAVNFEAQIPLLRELVAAVLDLSSELFDSNVEIAFETDHLGFMMLVYASKQEEHLQSIRTLIDHGRDRDAALIGRTMVEGLALLRWAVQEPGTRPELWRGYAYVADSRTARLRQELGVPPDEEHEATVKAYLDRYGDRYLSGKARAKQDQGKTPPQDPYRREWYDRDLASIFRDTNLAEVYESMYRATSDWTHWNILPIARSLTFEELRITYQPSHPLSAAASLTAGFSCLLEALKLVNWHFECGFDERLSDLERRFPNPNQPTPTHPTLERALARSWMLHSLSRRCVDGASGGVTPVRRDVN